MHTGKAMKKTTALVAIVAGIAVSITAHAQAQIGVVPGIDDVPNSLVVTPEITLIESKHDFGTIDDSTPVKATIRFKNTGTATLLLQQPKGSCGCTVPQLAKTDYAPGEEGSIEVTFNPTGKQKGISKQTVTIPSNDPLHATVVWELQAMVQPKTWIEPQMVSLGQFNRHQGTKSPLKIHSVLPNFAVTEVTSNLPEKIKPTIQGSATELGASGENVTVVTILVDILPGIDAGQTNGILTIRLSDGTVKNVSIFGEAVGSLMAEPGSIALQAIPVGQPVAAKTTVRRRDGGVFKITAAHDQPLSNPAAEREPFTVKFTPNDEANPTSYSLEITGTAPDKPMGLQGDIVVNTNIASDQIFTIKYYGFTRDNPAPNAALPNGQVPIQPVKGSITPNPLGSTTTMPVPTTKTSTNKGG